MLTIKHVESQGHETIHQARTVSYQPKDANGALGTPEIVFGFDSPGMDGGLQFGDGTVYVMNDNGKTIATYRLPFAEKK